MNIFKSLLIIMLLLVTSFTFTVNTNAGDSVLIIPDTEAGGFQLIGFFDLRDRESFFQVTNINPAATSIHVQIYDVSNNCNENDFFDGYTGNDTHIYNLRDITTNDGNPSGVVLPDNAYGIVYVTVTAGFDRMDQLIGNVRVQDNSGYEYRTNMGNTVQDRESEDANTTFNFNSNNGVILSDIIGISSEDLSTFNNDEVLAADVVNIWTRFDVDIYNNNEVPLSCRDVAFACVDNDNPLLEALLEESGVSVASFEYGINNIISHSKGGELLCPGNTIDEGIVVLTKEGQGDSTDDEFVLFVGLNNGNGRGSMDTSWFENAEIEN